MEHDYRTLDALFAPTPGRYGTHMAICGMTADIDTLERAMAVFTGQDRLARAASGWPRGVLMLDASQALPSASAVPGLVSLAHDTVDAWQARTALMHAKVVLMAFADAPFDAPTSFRLLVSTGNWTRGSWGAQSLIDMYWCSEWSPTDTSQTDLSLQACADIRAAYTFLDRLMQGLYGNSSRTFAAMLPWWTDWRASLAAVSAAMPTARFIHSLDQSLHAQIAPGFQTAKCHTVVAGSGFFEQPGADPEATPEVLEALGAMTPQARERYLVFNPSQAGALAAWISAASGARERKKLKQGQRGSWSLCLPADPLCKPTAHGRTQLHAKFVAAVARVNSKDKGTLSTLYLGSGNLSRRGLMSHARMQATVGDGDAGNIEAGIFTTDKLELESLWQALACGKLLTDDQLPALAPGDGEPLHVPLTPPPVLLVRHEGTQLIFVRSSDVGAFQFRLAGALEWHDVAADKETFDHAGQTPPFVVIRRQADDDESFEVPVASANGTLCRQPPPQLSADDVLDGLTAFPDAPAYAIDMVDDGAGVPLTALAAPPSVRLAYPLRWLATVIEAIAQRQSVVTPEQFPVWMSQVRTLLLEQIAPADLAQVRALHLQLFPALLEDGFKPAWLVPQHPHYGDYVNLIMALQAHWSLPHENDEEGGAPLPALVTGVQHGV